LWSLAMIWQAKPGSLRADCFGTKLCVHPLPACPMLYECLD
jgi:hypothetical protein